MHRLNRSGLIYLTIALLTVISNLNCHALDGAWRGELNLGTGKLPLIFHFSDENELQSCLLDSPMQGVKGIATEVTYCTGDSLALFINSIGASYTGHISSDKIEGVFSQRGFTFPLNLSPEQSLSERRPQTPQPPFLYVATDTTFITPDNIELAATITMPSNCTSDIPAVVMVTGSGPQNRDEEMFDHRPFAVIADYLARHGIASLRYDDRGTAKSGGDFKTADIDTFKSDASAAVKFLRGLNGIGSVGILGHSEGGTIALMSAADGLIDFAICLAAATEKGKDMILDQNLHTLKQMQLTDGQQADAVKLISAVFDDVIAGKDYADINVDGYVKSLNLNVPPFLTTSLKQNLSASSGSYFRKLLSLDPSLWLVDVNCPVLALNGTLDMQVNSTRNLGIIKELVKNATVKEYPGLNHLFQHATTGEVTEYINIRETISPEVLSDIVSFINSRDKKVR